MSQHYRYLIVGGGMAGDAAVRGIREVDLDGSIGVVGAEPDPPYNRPPLSKGLWRPRGKLRRIWRHTEQWDVTLHLGRTITALRPDRHWVLDHRGDEYTYEQLLLATGCRPRSLPFAARGVRRLYTVADYHALREAAAPGRRVAILGGGFLGPELAAALTGAGVEVTLLFPEPGIGGRRFPPALARALVSQLEHHGVTVRPGAAVERIEQVGDQLAIGYRDPDSRTELDVYADEAVAAIGARPTDGLARDAGLDVDDGIVVDECFRTSAPDVFAAGDVARYPCPVLGRRRVEHEDHANASGLAAGRAMAGAPEPYVHMPFLYSAFFDQAYEAVGELDGTLDTVEDWLEPYRRGTVYYRHEDRIRGVLLWGLEGQLERARELIRAPGPFRREDLIGRFPGSL